MTSSPETGSNRDVRADSEGSDTTTDSADESSETSEARCTTAPCVDERFRVDRTRSCDASEDGQRPARCEADPTAFSDWGPASALTGIEVGTPDARNCCFNLDGSKDGSTDNAFGRLMRELPIEVDRQIQAHLAAGTFIGLVEIPGLERVDRAGEARGVNIHLGVFGSDESLQYLSRADESCDFSESVCDLRGRAGERFLINPTTLDAGVHPEVQLAPVSVEGETLRAGPGNLHIQFSVPGMGRHRLPIRGATLEAALEIAGNGLREDGIAIENGRIGGYVLMRDLVELLNGLVGHCDCLGRPENAVVYPNSDPADPDFTTAACESGSAADEECRVQCRDSLVETGECSQLSNVMCRRFSTMCLGMNSLVRKADLDTDGDGYLDALSFGAIFEGTGAKIGGVSDYLEATEARLVKSGDAVVVEQVFTNRRGWLALFEPEGRSMQHLAHTSLTKGNHEDVRIALPESVETPRSLMVVPFADDGPQPGRFEPGEDAQLRWYYPGGLRIASGVQVRPSER